MKQEMILKSSNTYMELAQKVGANFKKLPQVEAIAVSGSICSGKTDEYSDIDLYVYIRNDIPVETRKKIISEIGFSKAEFNNQYWDTGDEWFEKETGIVVDIMYWNPEWIEEQLSRTLDRNEAWVGYSTSHWHTVRNSKILYDRSGWFEKLQEKSKQPYPELLRKNIINKNFPLLQNAIPAYVNQVEKAIKRKDLVTINHRVTAYLASYFEVIFALNKIPNPGEKRMIENVKSLCKIIPDSMEKDVNKLLLLTATINEEILTVMNSMTAKLEKLLNKEEVVLKNINKYRKEVDVISNP